MQVVRLYLGYLGNLGEKVPELAGFWLLTILLQLPMQVCIICKCHKDIITIIISSLFL